MVKTDRCLYLIMVSMQRYLCILKHLSKANLNASQWTEVWLRLISLSAILSCMKTKPSSIGWIIINIISVEFIVFVWIFVPVHLIGNCWQILSTLPSKRNATLGSGATMTPIWGQRPHRGKMLWKGVPLLMTFWPMGSLTLNWGHGGSWTKCCVSFGGEYSWLLLL